MTVGDLIEYADLAADASAVRAALARARVGLVDRAVISETVVLCAIAGEHLLVVGPPGTGKSEAVRRIAQQLGGAYFDYLLGRFTEPNEIFGPVDLRRLREGIVEIETSGMLPEADIAFLDEVFLGSTAILNTLLGLLNERRFRRGSSVVVCPLRVCVGAANTLPDDPALAAFSDRFLARIFVEPVEDSRLEELMEAGWHGGEPAPAEAPLLTVVDRLAAAARVCDLSAVRPTVAIAVRRMRGAGLVLSDRRAIRVQRLIAAAAAVDGRTSAGPQDLWVLPLIAPSADTQALARESLGELLTVAASTSLVESAAELARGPAARVERLSQAGAGLLTEIGPGPASPATRLRVEGVLREIDATVAASEFNTALREVRTRLAAALE